MKVLVTGAAGQLGQDLLDDLAGDDVVGLSRKALDVTEEPAVVAAVRDHRPDVVVHAAAVTGVEDCETAPEAAWRTNATGTWWVARACALSGAALVYLSSSEVFDGRAARPYTEFDRPSPLSVYGRTKEAGEQLVRQTLPAHYIVRTSWLIGRRGSLATALLRRRGAGPALAGGADERRNPTFTFDLAPAIRRLAVSGRHGTYHLTNTGACTWDELAAAAVAAAGDGARTSLDAEPSPASAPRPKSIVLDNLQARLTGVPTLPSWQQSLGRLVDELLGSRDRAAPEGR